MAASYVAGPAIMAEPYEGPRKSACSSSGYSRGTYSKPLLVVLPVRVVVVVAQIVTGHQWAHQPSSPLLQGSLVALAAGGEAEEARKTVGCTVAGAPGWEVGSPIRHPDSQDSPLGGQTSPRRMEVSPGSGPLQILLKGRKGCSTFFILQIM